MGEAVKAQGVVKGLAKADRKVAVAFLGITRALWRALPSITENLIDPARTIAREVRTFGHPFTLTAIRNARSGEESQPNIAIFTGPDLLYHDCMAEHPYFLTHKRGKRLYSERLLKFAVGKQLLRTMSMRASRVRSHGLLEGFTPGRGPMGKREPLPLATVRTEAPAMAKCA